MKRFLQKILRVLTAIVLSVMVAGAGYSAPAVPVYAESENAYDSTRVEDDLKDVDLSLYPADELGSPAIASFVEYCYTENVWKSGNYALYVYVYNPSQKEFSSRGGANMINMATSYDEEGKPSGYNLLPLKLCGATVAPYDRLIYKFRVEDAEAIYANATEYAEKYGYRRYDVADLLLYEAGAAGAEKCVVGREYRYTGYAKGYGEDENAESTLECEWKQAEVYDAEVFHTNYRMESEYKDYTRHEVNTVYFSVPDEYITDYGNLQGIRAQWYEYMTSPIFVTEDGEAYEALSEYIGKNIGEKDETLKWRVLWEESSFGMGSGIPQFDGDYNRLSEVNMVFPNDPLPMISWLFSTGGESYADYRVSRERIETWAESYSETYGKGTEIQGRYSSELFEESIDEDRVELLENPEDKRGLIVRDFDADEEFNLLAYDDTHSGWQRFWDYFLNWGADTSGKTYNPIEEITSADLTKAESDFCSEFLIDKDDYDAFYAFCSEEIGKGNHPFVFRFAQTDYYSSAARFDYVPDNPLGSGSSLSDVDGYVARQTVFLDFTMIHLKFQKDGTETVIPVAQNPLDIWNATDAPIETTGDFDWKAFLKLLGTIVLGIVGLILLVWILSMIFPALLSLLGGIFKLLWTIISAPFKWLGDKLSGSGKKK